MAKGRKLPPKKNIGKTVKAIIAKGPKTQPRQTLAKGATKSHVQQVQKSRVPKPSQNQRGKTPDKGGMDLTR